MYTRKIDTNIHTHFVSPSVCVCVSAFVSVSLPVSLPLYLTLHSRDHDQSTQGGARALNVEGSGAALSRLVPFGFR